VATAPLVTVLLAVANGERYLQHALQSVLAQSVVDLELVVVDDGSTDGTPHLLEAVRDPRLRVLRHEERRGLAASLNRGLDEARGRYLARLDADDVALAGWLAACLALLGSSPRLGFVGTGVLDIDEASRPARVHLHEGGRAALRWRALFSAPVFHDTVVLEREVLERHGLRYDETYGESEDYDLWTRLLDVTEGDAVEEPLVLHRLHPAQASRLRGGLQRSLALEISLREIAELAPLLSRERAELARRVALGGEPGAAEVEDAVAAYVELLGLFVASGRYRGAELRGVLEGAARAVARAARRAEGSSRLAVLREAARLDRSLPLHVARRRAHRGAQTRDAHREAAAWLAALDGGAGLDGSRPRPLRVAAVFPEPTPYRAPLLDRVAALDEVDLTVLYAARTVAGRTWRVAPRHPAVFLRGVDVPGADRVLHHDYPLTPGVGSALAAVRPEVVVVSGWSTFAAQAAIAWSRLRKVPYVLVVESHDEGPRAGWRRAVKGAVVPRIVRGAAGVLVTGTLARRSMLSRGAAPDRVHVFANTIDVEAFGGRVDGLAARRPALRESLGAGPDDVVVLSVARLAPEKGLDVLVHAVAETGDPRIVLVVAGDGPERERLEDLAAVRGARLVLTGDLDWERVTEVYAAADVFALLSRREPWAVVVNEAAASGLPLVLSDRVGAAHDLLRDGENGFLVAAGDVDGVSRALRTLAADGDLRRRQGARSRELARDWGYGPSVEGLLTAVREAVA
jgi:glycosyltransferase involved in cell wall biosynthesis